MVVSKQKNWSCPVGSFRFSDHWAYRNWEGNSVYCTDIPVPSGVWAIAINTNQKPKAWRVIKTFPSEDVRQGLHRSIGEIKEQMQSSLLGVIEAYNALINP